MLRALLRDALVYGASTVLTRAAALLVVPIYTRVLRPAEYGAIDILSIFGNLVTLTVALEIGQAVARFLPEADSDQERARVVSTASIFALSSYTAFLAIALAFVEPLRTLLVGDEASSAAVVVSLAWIWAVGIFQLIQTVLRFAMRPVVYMIASLVFSLGGLLLSVTLVLGFDAGVAGVFGGQVVAAVAASAVAAWFVRPLYAATFDRAVLRRMLAFSVPLVPAGLGVFVTLYVDRIALNQLASLAAVGVFGIGYRLATVVSLLLIGFQMALTPLIYQRYREPATPAELARVFRAFVGFALVATAGLSLFAPEILRVLTTRSYYDAAGVVPLLAPAVLLANMYVFMPGLAIAKLTRTIASITIGGAVLNTVLNLLLIPVLGIQGAALATLISSIGVFAAYAVTSQRVYAVPHRWAPIAVVVVAYVAVVFIGAQLPPMSVTSITGKLAGIAVVVWLVLRAGLVTRSELGATLAGLRPGARSTG